MTSDQLELLEVYRQLDPEQKRELIRFPKTVLKQQESDKKPKIRKKTEHGRD
jgi:hypothetical protein